MDYIRRKFSELYAVQLAEKSTTRYGTYNFSDDEIIRYTTIKYRPGLIQKSADYAVVYHADRDVIGIYFQGSSDIGDWSANATTTTKSWGTVKYNGKKFTLKIHKGWLTMYSAMQKAIHKEYEALRKEHPTADLEISGHSLGAGQAQLCAVDIYRTYGDKCHCFTFGSVKPFYVGNDALIKAYIQSCCHEVYNFCDTSDMVCYLPPFDGFDHINAVWISYADSGLNYKIENIFSYHFVYDIEKLYEDIEIYKDGVPTLDTNKVTY